MNEALLVTMTTKQPIRIDFFDDSKNGAFVKTQLIILHCNVMTKSLDKPGNIHSFILHGILLDCIDISGSI